MGLSAAQLRTSLDALAARVPEMARALSIAGYPEPRIRPERTDHGGEFQRLRPRSENDQYR